MIFLSDFSAMAVKADPIKIIFFDTRGMRAKDRMLSERLPQRTALAVIERTGYKKLTLGLPIELDMPIAYSVQH